MSDFHFPRQDSTEASDSSDAPRRWGLMIPEGPGRWVSDREMDIHEGEVTRLRGEVHRLKSELAVTQAAAQQDHDALDVLRGKVEALADEWANISGLPAEFSYADLEKATPAQRTLREASDDLRAVLKGAL